MDEETERLIAVLRPMVKGHIKQTRNLLGFLTELEKRLETHSQEAERGTEERQAA